LMELPSPGESGTGAPTWRSSKPIAQPHADYEVKHAAHVNISGTVLQRTNHVTLVSKASGCEIQVVSNYSRWEHNHKGDFKKRVMNHWQS
jgi:hypothetical protein